MNALLDRLLRFDARALGLFRWLVGIALIGDLLHRWDWARAFYSNEGVLENHEHLFHLREKGEVWSLFHSFSSVEEAHAGFLLVLFCYLAFTLGWHTRVFHLASVIGLVSLLGRNVMLDTPGSSLAVGLLALTAFLPLGLRFSVDSLRRSFEAFDEKTPADLDDRSRPEPPAAPAGLIPVMVLAFLALVYYGAALQQTGSSWQDGTALHYALHVDRWTSATGVAIREAFPPAVLSVWTRALWIAEVAVVPLALVPVLRRVTRSAAIALMLVHGLTFGLLFTYGLYGWSLAAASALLVPRESWDALKQRRKIRLYYDDDCGICLWLARLVKRLDLRQNIRFFPSSGKRPKGVSREMLERSMVVIAPDGSAHTDADAVSQVLRSLPLLAPLGWLLRVPGIHALAARAYDALAARRIEVSVALGMAACGTEAPEEGEPEVSSNAGPPAPAADAPARRLGRGLRIAAAHAGALVLLVAFSAQTAQATELPALSKLSEAETLASFSRTIRMMGRWGVWAPNPPDENASLVVDATTRGDWNVDLLTGFEPDVELDEPARHRKGVLWEAYQRRLRSEAFDELQKELRQYLTRGGFAIAPDDSEHRVRNLEVLWVRRNIPPPGVSADGEVETETLFGRNLPKRPSRGPAFPIQRPKKK